ncbi:phage scaffolding protein [Lactiplantibacillus sp. WILCCON 0030]|uniref:Phage scaffolding protein n=1 Tax=Lactiplantibacillus brownii TaxID=3069269 RepID=A0ABU1A888_9LACO|nr:phage scaffolding protein [Lactiplantibacillus brownii]MDQ7937096.1 phage scaffolding protein [Lactiplantibacillus brownii]
MKREALKKMGLTDEQINSIMETNGHDIENAKASVGDVETIKQENETLKGQLSTRDKDMKALKKQLGDNEDLTKQVTDLQTKYDQDTEKLAAQLTQTKLNGALDSALTDAKARNPKAVRGLLDMDKVKLTDDGKLDGFGEQLDALKKSDAYLFDEGKQPHYDPKGGGGPQDDNPAQALIDAFKQ